MVSANVTLDGQLFLSSLKGEYCLDYNLWRVEVYTGGG